MTSRSQRPRKPAASRADAPTLGVEAPSSQWLLDARTRELGRRGIAAARLVLADADRRRAQQTAASSENEGAVAA